MLGCSIIVLGVCLRKVFAAALMLALSASLLLVSGTLAVNNSLKNGTTGQIDHHGTKAGRVTTFTNGNQPYTLPVTYDPLPVTPVPPETHLNYTVVLIDYPNGTDSTAKNTNGTSVGDQSVAPVQSEVFTNISVEPNSVVVSVNQTFSVDVWINNVTDMAGWGIDLLWNSSVLKCVQAQVNTPPEWGGAPLDLFNKTEADANKIDPNAVYNAWLLGPGIVNDYDASYGELCNDYNPTCGLYERGECRGPNGGEYHNTFNGSIAIVTLTFQALQAGSTSLDFGYVQICNAQPAPITNVVFNGFVEVP
jgi:hypothetical protein